MDANWRFSVDSEWRFSPDPNTALIQTFIVIGFWGSAFLTFYYGPPAVFLLKGVASITAKWFPASRAVDIYLRYRPNRDGVCAYCILNAAILIYIGNTCLNISATVHFSRNHFICAAIRTWGKIVFSVTVHFDRITNRNFSLDSTVWTPYEYPFTRRNSIE